MKIDFSEVHARYRGNYRIAWSEGFSAQFPHGKIFRECDFCRFLGDAPGNPWRHTFAVSFLTGDCVKKLAFCTETWGVILVNMSSNFTRITLHRSCFPVCLPNDGPNF